jgi:hypothetical protein
MLISKINTFVIWKADYGQEKNVDLKQYGMFSSIELFAKFKHESIFVIFTSNSVIKGQLNLKLLVFSRSRFF